MLTTQLVVYEHSSPATSVQTLEPQTTTPKNKKSTAHPDPENLCLPVSTWNLIQLQDEDATRSHYSIMAGGAITNPSRIAIVIVIYSLWRQEPSY